MTTHATLSVPTRFTGRTGRRWEPRSVQLRPGHLRASGAAALRATRLVKDEDTDVYGALRVFPDRRRRATAAALLASGSPVTPALLDLVDHPGLPPALVTAWAPGDSSVPLAVLRERDDLAAMLEAGHRWTPAEALRTLVPLGRALDDLAHDGFVPLELSPDHLVVNSGSLALVGLGRHGYLPGEGRMPAVQGMSLPSALLLGDDLPAASAGGGDTSVRWREIQLRALTRLAGWMACGLPPAAWGPVGGPADLGGYLSAAGFQRVPALRPGRLAETLGRAAAQEEQARARRDFTDARALLVYDDGAQSTGGHRLDINPEVLRLGLLHDHGPHVIALAAFDQGRLTSRTATQLSGAGWVLLPRKDLAAGAARAAAAAPGARLVIAGRMGGEQLGRIESARGGRAERVDPEDLSGAVPRIAGMHADRLPYLTDRDMDAYGSEILGGAGGQSMRRRTFAAGWTLALGGTDTMPGLRERSTLLHRMTDAFGTNTELLVAVRARQNTPGLRKQNKLIDDARMRRLVTALSGVPSSEFRDCLMSALLGVTAEDIYDEATRTLLPVATRLAEVFDPVRPVGGDALSMEEALRERPGLRRVGLYGRLCTAVTQLPPARLAAAVSGMDDALVSVLGEIPAPSLQFLAGRLEDPELLTLLRPHLEGPDLDLLARYTPQMWRTLLDGLRQPEQLGPLGLGWVQIAAQDPEGRIDARVLLRIATDAGLPGPQAVRALLATDPAQWPALCGRPGLAARWLAEQGDLDFAEILADFPDPEAALAELGTDGLRHARELGLDQRAMGRIRRYADGLGVRLDEVLIAFQERHYDSAQAAPLDTAAAVEWSRWQLGRGRTLGWTVGNVVERPAKIRDWAVDGPGLSARMAAEILGGAPAGPPQDARAALPQEVRAQLPPAVRAALPGTLAAAPALLPLLASLTTARERAALLALHVDEPDAVLDPRARGELPAILGTPDPGHALRTLLAEGLGVVAQQVAARLGLTPEQRRTLAELTPLAGVLGVDALSAVLTAGVHHGVRAAVTAAVIEQRLPGTAEAVVAWGPRWLPWLAGGSGPRVLRLLAEQRDRHSGRSGQVTPWLLAAGEDGLALVERFGSDALDLVRETGAPPDDARLLGELLMLPGPAPVLYRLITENGLPADCWPGAAALLAGGEEPDRVLLRLWSSTRR